MGKVAKSPRIFPLLSVHRSQTCINPWLNGFYHSLDIDELNDLYCTEEELAELKRIEEAYDFGEARRRIREISKELEYSKIALRMKALLNM